MVLKRSQSRSVSSHEHHRFASRFFLRCKYCFQNNFSHASLVASIPAIIAGILSTQSASKPENFPPWFFSMDSQCYSMLGWVLGFILVFRTGQAYNRFWSGADLLHQLGTVWYKSCAQIVCFAETSGYDPVTKYSFQLSMTRLYSLLHCFALQQISDVDDDFLEVIDPQGIGMSRLEYVHSKPEKHRAEVIAQWIQGSFLEAAKVGIINTPAPIASQAFQQLHSGFLILSQMQNISETQFPVPYGRMIYLLLFAHACFTPFFMVNFTNHWMWASTFAFISVFSLWIIAFIAIEIEMPFGSDGENIDFPSAQLEFNEHLRNLAEPEMRVAPEVDLYLHTGLEFSELSGNAAENVPASSRPSTTAHGHAKTGARMSLFQSDAFREQSSESSYADASMNSGQSVFGTKSNCRFVRPSQIFAPIFAPGPAEDNIVSSQASSANFSAGIGPSSVSSRQHMKLQPIPSLGRLSEASAHSQPQPLGRVSEYEHDRDSYWQASESQNFSDHQARPSQPPPSVSFKKVPTVVCSPTLPTQTMGDLFPKSKAELCEVEKKVSKFQSQRLGMKSIATSLGLGKAKKKGAKSLPARNSEKWLAEPEGPPQTSWSGVHQKVVPLGGPRLTPPLDVSNEQDAEQGDTQGGSGVLPVVREDESVGPSTSHATPSNQATLAEGDTELGGSERDKSNGMATSATAGSPVVAAESATMLD